MKKIRLDFQLKNLDGTDIDGEPGHLGKTLGGILYRSNQGNSVKFAAWALKLYNSPHEIEIDASDKDALIDFLKTVNTAPNTMVQVPNMITAAAINAIREQWEKKSEPKK